MAERGQFCSRHADRVEQGRTFANLHGQAVHPEQGHRSQPVRSRP
ncbi:hypothetical protein BCL80_12612 [Streptomyces avidinii]|nr:hypothetical protein BCL80_12612 [Streptomyces avidinii]SNX81208.1 hypothetical protein SAMN05421860_12115 [Streptomyces microflavus]